jgi:hypothetical protein
MNMVCEVCGNKYDKPIEVTFDGKTHSFDCFECAIHLLAPKCEHCGCRVIGHGHEVEGRIYCCAHCGNASGEKGFVDRLDDVPVATR